jgi:hypothetical protein
MTGNGQVRFGGGPSQKYCPSPGRQLGDGLPSTDVDCAPEWVAEHYAGRWSIEDTFRNVKQFLGGQQPQSWRHQGPERAAGLSLWIYSATWLWYLTTQGTAVTWKHRPWYPKKATPSFVDALACLRRTLWHRGFSRLPVSPSSSQKRRR